MSLSLDRLSSVHGAALDGRAASVRFQQSQLIALHAKLQHLQAEACEAIVYDRGVTTAEAEIECATTILTVCLLCSLWSRWLDTGAGIQSVRH